MIILFSKMVQKHKEGKIIIGSIVLIFVAITIAILAILLVVTVWILSTQNYAWDISNWITLLIEIGIGIGIAFAVLIYERNQQVKFQQQQDKISELVTEIKNLTEEQKRFREGRHRWALFLVRIELNNLDNLIGDKEDHSINQKAKTMAHNLEQITYQSGDVIEPQFIMDINKICEIIKPNTDKTKFMTFSGLHYNRELKNLINGLISQFEKIYPSV